LPAAEKFVLQGYPSLGFIPEGDKRYTFLFGSTATRIMYTVWDYRDDGASITQVEEFFNVKIHEEPGVIAVLANQNTENILWKLTWLKNGVSHEIYVEDKKSRRGTPSRSPAEIVRLAEEL
jgi:hypothetical protein